MIRMKMTAKDDNLFTLIKFWKLPFIVVKNVVAVRSFNQKSTVVNVSYLRWRIHGEQISSFSYSVNSRSEQ